MCLAQGPQRSDASEARTFVDCEIYIVDVKHWNIIHQSLKLMDYLPVPMNYSKTCLKGPFKKTKIGFQDRLSPNAGQKYCRMLRGEHSAILSTCIKLPFDMKIFVLSIFEWPLKTDFTLLVILQ